MLPNITPIAGTTDAGQATPIDPALAQTNTPAVDAPETPAQPAYVTKEELERTTAEIIRRVQQSSKDRAKQITNELSAIKSRLEVTGVQLSAQQEDALRNKISDELENPAEQAGAQASALPPEVQAQVNWMYSQIDETFADIGTKVTPNDPEWKAVQTAIDDPKGSFSKVILAAGKAANAKAERVNDQKTNAPARVVSGGGAQALTAKTMTAEEKIAAGLSGDWSNRNK